MAFFNFCYVSSWFKILSVSFVFQCGLFCLGLNPISEVRGWVGIWRRWYGRRRVWIDLSRNKFKSSFSDLKYKRYVPKNCSTTSVDVVTVHLFFSLVLLFLLQPPESSHLRNAILVKKSYLFKDFIFCLN